MSAPLRESSARPGVADFHAVNRRGGLFSETVSQRAGSLLAMVAHRLGLAPATLTLSGLAISLSASVALIVLAPSLASEAVSTVLVGLVAGLGWQVAWVFDCADGQLARVTGQASDAGGRLDILCDVGGHVGIVAALVTVTAARAPGTPAWLYALFAGTWMVNVVTSILARGPAHASLIPNEGVLVRVVKLSRDYGAVIAVCALVVAFAPAGLVGLLALLCVVNGLFLLASIGQAARRAYAEAREAGS